LNSFGAGLDAGAGASADLSELEEEHPIKHNVAANNK
jgi:hypothetical protein